jgi:hypothetical protein
MEKESGKEPEALPDEALDDAAGGLLPAVHTGGANRAGITDGTSNITDGTSKAGFAGGVFVAAGDVNGDGKALKIADGSVKPGA